MKKLKKSKIIFSAILSILGASPFSSAVEKNKTTGDKIIHLVSSIPKIQKIQKLEKKDSSDSSLSKAQKIGLASIPVGAAIVLGGVRCFVKNVDSKKILEPIPDKQETTKTTRQESTVPNWTNMSADKKAETALKIIKDNGVFIESKNDQKKFLESPLYGILFECLVDQKKFDFNTFTSKVDTLWERFWEDIWNYDVSWEETGLPKKINPFRDFSNQLGYAEEYTLLRGKNENYHKNIILKKDFSQILVFDTKSGKSIFDVSANKNGFAGKFGVYYIREN